MCDDLSGAAVPVEFTGLGFLLPGGRFGGSLVLWGWGTEIASRTLV